MSDYIDRERLKKALNADLQTLQTIDEHSISLILAEIDEAPSGNVAPVVHGRWGMHSDRPDTLICSICDQAFDVWKHDIDRMHYCPNCGAKMDEEQEEPTE